MATTSSMFMYSLTIQPPTAVTQAILGQFAGTKEQQIVTASGSHLTLHRPDPAQGKIITALSHDVFGIIRTLAAFRLAGSSKGKLHPLPIIASLSDLKHVEQLVPRRCHPSPVAHGSRRLGTCANALANSDYRLHYHWI
jgi:hypothetical protein